VALDSDEAYEIPLFATAAGKVQTKEQMAAGWQSLAPAGHPKASGHTARRSGAKHYARRAWRLLSIQGLGRWGGPSVLFYAEEALHELARDPARGDVQLAEGIPENEDAPVEALTRRVERAENALGKLRKEVHALADTPRPAQVEDSSPEETALVLHENAEFLELPAIADIVTPIKATTGNKRVHILASLATGDAPAWATTRCGWRAGSSENYVHINREDAQELFGIDDSVACARCKTSTMLE